MTHKPKLELYKLKLIHKEEGKSVSFRDLFRSKFGLWDEEAPLTLEKFFNIYFQNLVKELDSEGFYINEKKKKGYTLAYRKNQDGEDETFINRKSNKWNISGVLDGGPHGLNRSLSLIEDKKDVKPIKPNNIVCDKFYFLLSTPVDHSEAIIIVQGYTGRKIADVFRDHMQEFFSYEKTIKSKVEIFVPNFLKEEYLDGATFNSLNFSTGWAVKPDFEQPEGKTYELKVKVEITDVSEEKADYNLIPDLIEKFGNVIVKMGQNASKQKKLEAFNKKTARVNSNGKPIAIKFDKENEITPVVLLEDHGIHGDPNTGEVNFELLEAFCQKLLEQIEDEDLPSNAVQEL